MNLEIKNNIKAAMINSGKHLMICFLTLLSFSLTTFAEETSVSSSPTPSNSEDLTQAFQREYTYLVSQKSALKEQKKILEKNLNQKIEAAQLQTKKAQKDLVWLSAENDESHEYLLSLERRKKDLQKRDFSLESVYKKSIQSIGEFKSGLYFEVSKTKSDVVAPSDLKFEDFDSIISEASDLLVASTQVEEFPSSFLNSEEKLVDGVVTRIGRSAAIGYSQDEYFVLGPDGKGMLKALSGTVKPSTNSDSEIGISSLRLYVFDSIHKISEVKKHGGLTEKLADLSPILFLGMMLMMVLGLFVAMIRV